MNRPLEFCQELGEGHPRLSFEFVPEEAMPALGTVGGPEVVPARVVQLNPATTKLMGLAKNFVVAELRCREKLPITTRQ